MDMYFLSLWLEGNEGDVLGMVVAEVDIAEGEK
jgi:hypothetical protein